MVGLSKPGENSKDRGLDPSQRRLLHFYSFAWVTVGGIVALKWGTACVAEEGTLSIVNAWCAELALFGFVCWALLGVMLGFPLYYWLNQRKRAGE